MSDLEDDEFEKTVMLPRSAMKARAEAAAAEAAAAASGSSGGDQPAAPAQAEEPAAAQSAPAEPPVEESGSNKMPWAIIVGLVIVVALGAVFLL